MLKNRVLEAVWTRLCKWRLSQVEALIRNHENLASAPGYDAAGHRKFANDHSRLAAALREEIECLN